MTYEAMIDIETLDTGPRSVVLSIGAVLFDQDEGVIGDPFYVRLDIDAQLVYLNPRTVSQSTLLWWMGQSDEARDEAFHPDDREDPYSALLALHSYLDPWGVEDFWANGPAFDLVVLGSLYEEFGEPTPWRYNQGRDMRTLREVSGMPRDWAPPNVTGVEHHPVYDCEFQVEVVREARRRIGTAYLPIQEVIQPLDEESRG